jgi:hypothetical protein
MPREARGALGYGGFVVGFSVFQHDFAPFQIISAFFSKNPGHFRGLKP